MGEKGWVIIIYLFIKNRICISFLWFLWVGFFSTGVKKNRLDGLMFILYLLSFKCRYDKKQREEREVSLFIRSSAYV